MLQSVRGQDEVKFSRGYLPRVLIYNPALLRDQVPAEFGNVIIMGVSESHADLPGATPIIKEKAFFRNSSHGRDGSLPIKSPNVEVMLVFQKSAVVTFVVGGVILHGSNQLREFTAGWAPAPGSSLQRTAPDWPQETHARPRLGAFRPNQ